MRTPWRSNATSRTVALGVAVVMAFAAAVLRGRAPDSTVLLAAGVAAAQGPSPFTVEEATIDDLHRAIQDGRTTCARVVRAYIERARAYNGACTTLVTKDGAPVAAASGPMRAGRPVSLPTRTRAVTDILPDIDKYTGLPLDYGRMSATASDPHVQQQYGMVAGMADAGQVNALSTLNIRGERSVSCQAACDAPVASGPLPASCPAACDAFRQAARRARASRRARRDVRTAAGSRTRCRCTASRCRSRTSSTRPTCGSTGGADVNYAMDAPPRMRRSSRGCAPRAPSSTRRRISTSTTPAAVIPAARQRRPRAITARARAARGAAWPATRTTPRARRADRARDRRRRSRRTWPPARSARRPAAPAASRRGATASFGFVTTKGLIPYGGAIGADPYLDRAGIQCRTVADTARVLDAVKDPQARVFDPRDIYSALPAACRHSPMHRMRSLIGRRPAGKPLDGRARRHRA